MTQTVSHLRKRLEEELPKVPVPHGPCPTPHKGQHLNKRDQLATIRVVVTPLLSSQISTSAEWFHSLQLYSAGGQAGRLKPQENPRIGKTLSTESPPGDTGRRVASGLGAAPGQPPSRWSPVFCGDTDLWWLKPLFAWPTWVHGAHRGSLAVPILSSPVRLQ